MAKAKIKKIAKMLELRLDGDLAYALKDDLLVSVFETEGTVSMCFDAYLAAQPEELRVQLKEFISEEMSRYGISAYTVGSTGIKVDFVPLSNTDANAVDFYYCAAGHFEKLGLKSSAVCSNCGKKLDSPVIVSVEKFAHCCDAACAKKLLGSFSRGAKKYKANAGSGYVGALLFSLLGGALWALLAQKNIFPPISALAIALLAHLGYRLFGGRRSVARFFAVTLFPLISIVLANFASHMLALINGWSADGFVTDIRETAVTVFGKLAEMGEFTRGFGLQIAVGFAIILLVAVGFAIKVKGPADKKKPVRFLEGVLIPDASASQSKSEA